MTILTKPSAGAKQIPKTLNAESVENGAVIEQVHFFNTFFFFLSFSTSLQKKQRTCFMASYYRYYKILVQLFFCCSFCLLFHSETLLLQKEKKIDSHFIVSAVCFFVAICLNGITTDW